MAFVIGLGLMVTTSAFTAKDSNKGVYLVYGYDESNPSAPWVAQGTPGYSCQESTKICKYRFNSPPSNTPGSITLRSAGIPDSDDLGSYQLPN